MSASFYDILKYAATGIASPSMTYYDKMRASTLMGGVVKTLTGHPPLSFKSDGTPLTSVTIKGNGQQNGTPSPQNIVPFDGCGDLVESGEHAGQYAIPLTCASQTTPLYLGEVSTTRRIKKLVLTGTSADGNANITSAGVIYITPVPTLKNVGNAYCTHYKYVNQGQGASMPTNSFTTLGGAGTSLWFKTDYTTVTDFKAFLAAQYAAGHPVTVWYVLATPETGIVNEPLYRIGDYADTLTTDTPIPTAKGSNTLTVDTTVQPSEVSITGNIKPES